jgi:hypothetical protein
MEDEENLFDLFQGCPVHGEEYMKECSLCGGEYCKQCFPGSNVCPSCSAEIDEEDDVDDPDFLDVDDLDTLIGEDEEVDDIIRQSDEMYEDDEFE